MQRALERQYARVIAAEIRRQMEGYLAAYERSRSVPTDTVMQAQRFTSVYADMTGAAIRTFGVRIVEQGKSIGEIETKAAEGFAAFFARLASEWISQEAIRRRIASVTETTRQQIVSQVAKGQEQGLGVSAIAKLIRDKIPGMSRLRAAIIARTETHAASNYGANETAKTTGLELAKEWVSVEDSRTRDFGEGDGVVDEFDHRAMNGQTVDMDQPFLMPWRYGDPIMCDLPGDPSLPPAASINCRCAVVHVVKGFGD